MKPEPSSSVMEIDGTEGMNSIDALFSNDPKLWCPAVRQMKNIAIGNNKQKTQLMMMGVVPRLLHLLLDEGCILELKLEAAVLLGSLARGTEDNIRALVDSGCVSVLLKDLDHSNIKYVEACLRCLRTIFISKVAPVDLIYQDPNVVPQMIAIISKSTCTQESITSIISNCCRALEHQAILCSNGAVAAFAPLLTSNIYRVQMPTLKCFAVMCYQNSQVAQAIATAAYNGESIPNILVRLLTREKTSEMQIAAARSLTYLCRAGALDATDYVIHYKALPTLIRMCKSDRAWEERVEGAETLAYLIEVDTTLQKTAAISDHIIKTLSEYFKYPGPNPEANRPSKRVRKSRPKPEANRPSKGDEITVGNELRQAAFRAYAAISANDEDIRKRIIETENLMDHIVNGLSDPVTKVQLAAVRCLHSLSRSVQQLRTSFQDHAVWKPLMKIIKNSPPEVVGIASSTLCNLLLEFSPSKDPMLEDGAIELLVDLTNQEDTPLKLNGIWALMNVAFQSDARTKEQIVTALGTDQLFRLLADPVPEVVMKTLGLLRNLLSGRADIDTIMTRHGIQMMQAVILILEGDHSVEVKEQALCILGNIADGGTSKAYIMNNDDVLRKVTSYMTYNNVKLQIAAVYCVTNLLWKDNEGALDRQTKLKELGIQKLLTQLEKTSNQLLRDKVNQALQHF